VVLAVPAALKVTVAVPNAPASVASVAVSPLMVVIGLVQGLLLSEHAVTVTVCGRQLTPLLGNDSS
jgi:hypothetical protein